MRHFLTGLIIVLSAPVFHLCGQALQLIKPDHASILYTGRIDFSSPDSVTFSYPGTSIKIKFEGSVCNIFLGNRSNPDDSINNANYYNLIVDNKDPFVLKVRNEDHHYKLRLRKGIHTLEIFKRTESVAGRGIFRGFEIEKDKKVHALKRPARKIEFIGNSITCGYGNEGLSPACHFSPATENNFLAYGAITARNLRADYMAVAYSGKGVTRNYDPEGKTLPELYNQIFPDQDTPLWEFNKWVPDVVVINLGTNDFAHTAPDSALFVKTYLEFLKTIRKNYPGAVLFCIEGSMIRDGWPKGTASLTLVKRYLESAVQIFRKDHDQLIHTFYLSTCREGDFGCDYHPNLKRHRIMAEELTAFIKYKTGW